VRERGGEREREKETESYKLAIQRFCRMANLKIISRISPIYEALSSLFSRCAHDSGLVGKVLCTITWIIAKHRFKGFCRPL
jgi:hypothetical protein